MNVNKQIPVELVNRISVTTDSVLTFPYYVFFYILEGSVNITVGVESETYHNGDIFLLPFGIKASLSAGKDCRLLLLGISTDFIQNYLNLSVLPVCNSTLNPALDYLEMKRLVLDISEEYRSRNCSELVILGNLYLLLNELKKLPGTFPKQHSDNRYTQRVQAIANYIDQHYMEPLSLPELAQEFYLAPQYLSTFFKDNFSTNFKNYLNEKRLFYSLRDLRQSKLSINDIALKNGFSSVSAYRKNFEAKYHITPSEFRLRHKNQTSMRDIPGSIPLPELASTERASALRQTYHINVKNEPQTLDHAGRILNIGSASNLLSAEYRKRLEDFVLENAVHYIRIQDVLSSSFIPMLLPDYDFYFRNVTSIITFLFDLNVVPIIEFSRNQFNFSVGPTGHNLSHNVSRSNRFYRLLEAFLQHIYSRWPLNWLNCWKFELWMQPNETLENYAKDLQTIRSVIQNYIPDAALGGPGYHKCSTPVPSAEFMKYFRQHNIRLDFFSAYLDLRDYDTLSTEITMSRNPDYLLKTCLALKEELAQYLPKTPLYATEWSSLFLEGVPLSYSRYQAAFIARNYLGLSRYCELSGYWLFSDRQFQSSQFLHQADSFMDGQGLCTSGMIPTAAFYAYQLCCRLGSKLIDSGNSYWFIQENENHYQLLACHYIHPRNFQSPELASSYSPDKVYSLFPDTPAMHIHFYLDHIKPGIYQIQRYVINETSGNLLDILIGEYTHSNISREVFLQQLRSLHPSERDYYEKAFIPEMRKIYTSAENTLHLETYMMQHCVCLWDIQRQL